MTPLAVMTVFCALVLIGVPWCQATFGTFDPMTNSRSCGNPPSEIRVWAFTHHTRRPEDVTDLQKWIGRHPRQIDKWYGAFCDTPLHYAARFGRADLADALIAGGATVDAPNRRDERPLHTAATYGHPDVVERLLARGADVNASDRGGKTPLHAAVSGLAGLNSPEGRVRVARLLLEAKADVNARDPGGFTPLRYAWGNRNTAMVELLLSYGADPRGAEDQMAPANRDR
jgi:hypothetical protein